MRALVLLAALAAAPLAAPVMAQAPPAAFRLVPVGDVAWRPVPGTPGVESAVLFGNPAQPGPYVIRVKFPPHVMDRPHRHSRDRHVTVLQGRWFAGTGASFDPARATPLPAGSYMFHPAGGIHWDGSNSDDTVIVQIIGEGPVSSEDIDPSQPGWVTLPH